MIGKAVLELYMFEWETAKILDNWDYKKHAAAVTAFYLGTAIVGNAILGKKTPKNIESNCSIANCCNTTKKQKIFNRMMAGFYCFDMSGTYLILDHFKKQHK